MLPERRRGAGTDRCHGHARERAGVATRRVKPLEQKSHAVGAREAHEVIDAEIGSRPVDRLERDGVAERLAEGLQLRQQVRLARSRKDTAATKVDFFTLVRGDNA